MARVLVDQPVVDVLNQRGGDNEQLRGDRRHDSRKNRRQNEASDQRMEQDLPHIQEDRLVVDGVVDVD